MSDYKVLIPLDGSNLAEHSLAYLAALRKLGDLKVELFSAVDETAESHSLTLADAVARQRNVLTSYLRDLAEEVHEHLEIDVTFSLGQGTPAEVILAEIQRAHPDLVIITTHGRSGLSRWRYGSVADKLIRLAGCNTLVVGPRAIERERWLEADLVPPFKSIAVPLDGSDLAEAALPVAMRLAAQYGSVIHLIRAVNPVYMEADMATMVDSLISAAHGYLVETSKRLTDSAPGIEVKTASSFGAAAGVVLEYAQNQNVDLIVMTSHGRSGIVRSTLGSTADRLIGGTAPVLIVRAAEA